MKKRNFVMAGIMATAMLLNACGGDGEGSPNGPSEPKKSRPELIDELCSVVEQQKQKCGTSANFGGRTCQEHFEIVTNSWSDSAIEAGVKAEQNYLNSCR